MAKRGKYEWLAVEKLGFSLSLLCAIHCLSLPLLVFFAPYLSSNFAFSEGFEWILVGLSFVLAFAILYIDFKKHRKAKPLWYLAAAAGIKILDLLIHAKGLDWVFGLSLGIFIALAYWVNFQHKSACTCKIKA